MTKINKKELQALTRNKFTMFVDGSFYELNPQTQYLPNWHVDVIAAALEECRVGKLRRLIINLPPRSLKSHISSVSYSAYLLGHNPSAQIICASYAQPLADHLAGQCRTLMQSEWYKEVFGTRLDPRKTALNDFATTAGGFRLATSVGGVLTGRGADCIVIDDPSKPDEAMSDTQRARVNEWYDHTLVSRLNDKRYGVIIIVMQRLHEDDLVGHVLPQGGWEILKFPAIAEVDEKHVIETPRGQEIVVRRAGEALHPDREPPEELNRLRRNLGEYHFAAQYQQNPSPLGGGMIKREWFKACAQSELPEEFDLIFQSWDTANKDTELSDYSVCTTWGVANEHLYLVDVLRERLLYPDLKRAVAEQAARYKPENILIEDKSSGTALIQELVAEGIHAVTAYKPRGDKKMRMHAASNRIENGFVHIPERADWLPEYLHEMELFPKGAYNDQVDSTSQALDWYDHGRSGVIEWLREEAIKFGYSEEAAPTFKKLPGWKRAFGSDDESD